MNNHNIEREAEIAKEEEHIRHILKYGCPPSPYQMRKPLVVTQRELDETEREYQRIKKEKEQRELEIEVERLRRENIRYTCDRCGSRMQHNGIRNHQVRWRCPNCGHTKTEAT